MGLAGTTAMVSRHTETHCETLRKTEECALKSKRLKNAYSASIF
jgi:hypothetical protein